MLVRDGNTVGNSENKSTIRGKNHTEFRPVLKLIQRTVYQIKAQWFTQKFICPLLKSPFFIHRTIVGSYNNDSGIRKMLFQIRYQIHSLTIGQTIVQKDQRRNFCLDV